MSDIKTKYKYIEIIKINNKRYDCHAGCYFIGEFRPNDTLPSAWVFLHMVTEGTCGPDKAKRISKSWHDIADFLDQLNKESEP